MRLINIVVHIWYPPGSVSSLLAVLADAPFSSHERLSSVMCCVTEAAATPLQQIDKTSFTYPSLKLNETKWKQWNKNRKKIACTHLRASEAAASAEAASAASSAAATAAAAALFRVASSLWMAEASAVGPLLAPGEGKEKEKHIRLNIKVGRFVACSYTWKLDKLCQTQQLLPTELRELTPALFCLDRCSLWHTEHMPLVRGLP